MATSAYHGLLPLIIPALPDPQYDTTVDLYSPLVLSNTKLPSGVRLADREPQYYPFYPRQVVLHCLPFGDAGELFVRGDKIARGVLEFSGAEGFEVCSRSACWGMRK